MTQDEINALLWKACENFRGTIDPEGYKNYVLVMLFLKYISDTKCHALSLPLGCRFADIYEQRNASNLGEVINKALAQIEEANKEKIEGVFRNIDFNSEANLGRPAQCNERLNGLLTDFANPRLDFSDAYTGNRDIVGDAYEYLIGKFAAGAGQKAGEFYTPPEVSTLLARLLDPRPGEYICDPACGSGSLLIKLARPGCRVFGQELNSFTRSLAVMNMAMHNIDSHIALGDTLKDPGLVKDGQLMRFDVVAANPPFSLDKWGASTAANDQYDRFWRGVPPKSKGDYAFISHILETTAENGRAGVVVPHGVLFRGSKEGYIRQQLVDENLLDAVIGLPPNLFYSTGIPVVILIFKRNRLTRDVLFIDASQEFEQATLQNHLRLQDIDHIAATYTARRTVDKYAYLAGLDEIAANDYNLNIPRYVDTFEPEPQVDLEANLAEIGDLDARLAEVSDMMNKFTRWVIEQEKKQASVKSVLVTPLRKGE